MTLPSVFRSTVHYVSHSSKVLENFTIEFQLQHILTSPPTWQQLLANRTQCCQRPRTLVVLQPTAWNSSTHLNQVQCPLQLPSCQNTKQPAEAIIGCVQKKTHDNAGLKACRSTINCILTNDRLIITTYKHVLYECTKMPVYFWHKQIALGFNFWQPLLLKNVIMVQIYAWLKQSVFITSALPPFGAFGKPRHIRTSAIHIGQIFVKFRIWNFR